MKNILLVEDDHSLGATLKERLEKEQFVVAWAKTLAQARNYISSSSLELAILDLSLPDGSGFDLASEIKTSFKIPLIFLTALSSAENRLKGYEIGADEFIPKPFHLKELLLRIQKILASSHKFKKIYSASLEIDLDSMSVKFPNNTHAHPATRDFKLLQLLVEVAPNVVSREQVLKALFPDISSEEELPTQRTIDNSILRLRQMLKQIDGEFIRSVRGVGYQWIPETKKEL